ncbi:MAG: hypothetical protein ACYDEB_07640 [Dehalococcoidia bacterium]
MLRGRFGNTTGRPYIEGRLLLPRLALRSEISFCVDTGADRTILLPSDSMRMNLDFSRLGNRAAAVGIGGTAAMFDEEAVIAFADKLAVYVYRLRIKIAANQPSIRDLPSLLGRDVLHRWHMNYHPGRNRLTMRVVTADRILPLRTRR